MWVLWFLMFPPAFVLAEAGLLGRGAKKEADVVINTWIESLPFYLVLAAVAVVVYAITHLPQLR